MATIETKYETGKLGLSEPEIVSELEEIRRNVMSRDEVAKARGVAYFYLQTPQEAHRINVLDAMRMANSCIIYGHFGEWLERKADFTQPYSVTFNVSDPKFLGTEELRAAHALTEDELNRIWAAQCQRVAKAKVIHNVLGPEEEGGPYHGVRW